ncbi:glutathione S-transferase C-terminal domain-containing protein homolog [Anticarsia gemmatalis]|uniref:glutathione S-transferase C-terminal domain-containing protein homolog n=1 Tax=Anticarsia gemmatalis TaxID=129554 RepID=UPI003F75C157
MVNVVFLEAYSGYDQYQQGNEVKIPLESLITYCIYKYCTPELVSLKLVTSKLYDDKESTVVNLNNENLQFLNAEEVPWQVASCIYPVVMFEDTIITGLCAVARHICKYKAAAPNSHEHEEGLLGFRKSCLQAPNEVSIWTKFCEVDIIKTVKAILESTDLKEVPKNLVRFENHLKKPVRVHNVYKIAREIKKESVKSETKNEDNVDSSEHKRQKHDSNSRVPKTRKWKSNKNKELEIDSSTKIEDLNINHQFAEGPFLTLADLVLLPSYHIIIQSFGETKFESLLPLTYKWYKNIISIAEVQILIESLNKLDVKILTTDNVIVPATEDVSLYKCDPKRHNPKKRLFTKEDDIENALSSITEQMELNVDKNEFESAFNWNDIPDGANPTAGHLPDERVMRKSQQLENLALAVMEIAKEGDLIVDFCSGSGHLGILLAHLLPKCTVILLENKEQSLHRARLRVHEMGLKNVYFFQCNLDFYVGKFDVGVALHACGIASDLVLEQCLRANAKFVLCPCCYGSLHATDRLVYPRSNRFGSVPIEQYLCIGHAADQTHEEHPLAVRGARCMAVIDSDRARLAEEFGYKVTLSRLKPLTCTPKNNLLVGVPT